jgi:hypothetical protein
MLRCTIEVIPSGHEDQARTVGIVEIGNDGTGTKQTGNYRVTLKKECPFYYGQLKALWFSDSFQKFEGVYEDAEVLAGKIEGFNRGHGPYDLLYRALKACGLDRS